MKKILTTILTLALLSTCLMGVSAAQVTTEGETTGDVTVNVVSSPAYLVNITWDSLAFQYKFDNWDPKAHVFKGQKGWQETTTREVKLVNHSNAAVTYTASFNASSIVDIAELNGVTAKLDKTGATLPTAVGSIVSKAPNDTFTVSVSGTPAANTAADFKVGTVTIKLS